MSARPTAPLRRPSHWLRRPPPCSPPARGQLRHSSRSGPNRRRRRRASYDQDSRQMAEYWYSRWLFERALAAIYLVAFIAAATQFVPLLGERGLEPVGRWVEQVPFRQSPSLFYFFPRDVAFRGAAWIGIVLSVGVLTSVPQRFGSIASGIVWAIL